jgi:hypothetical protein
VNVLILYVYFSSSIPWFFASNSDSRILAKASERVKKTPEGELVYSVSDLKHLLLLGNPERL